jgi:hypothetical protein
MTGRAQFPFATQYRRGESDVARENGNPAQPPVAELSELPVMPRERGSRYVRIGILGALVTGLVVALVVLLPPLIHQDRVIQPGGPPPPPGRCLPPIGPPPDLPPGGPPGPPPGVPRAGEPCPGPPTSGQGFTLVLTNRQVAVPASSCRTGIDLDTVTITAVTADTDLVYEPCGALPILRHPAGRPFGAAGSIYASTGKTCQTEALNQPLQNVPQHAPNLAGYCTVLAGQRVVHVLVQAWGARDRPNLRLQITMWQPARAPAT